MFGRKKRHKFCNQCNINRPCQIHTEYKHAIPLSLALADNEFSVICNPNPKCFELGLCHGNVIRVVKNNDYDRNLVIAVGDSRYIISRNVADNIMVNPLTP
ncbi:MAG: FeoA family protein [Candidatus Cloacimonetes bacterium]|jgi:Fe2+ transport system protein FeoA|nr:ferrous iron transport protein A [Candidatus Cloacimonadota bacterium]MDD4155154.1 FeoA family protein [Candidatus Cloacimonadota bacterium]